MESWAWRSRILISTSTRFKIVGSETIAVGTFLLLTFLLDQLGTGFRKWLPPIDSDLPIVGGALILVGLETLSLIRNLSPARSKKDHQDSETENRTGRLMSLRKLVALDIALHGTRPILFEFAITGPGMILLGLLIIMRSYWPLGAYIFLLGFNYLPLLFHAIRFKRQEGKSPDLDPEVRRFGVLQLLILVPMTIPILAILQRRPVS